MRWKSAKVITITTFKTEEFDQTEGFFGVEFHSSLDLIDSDVVKRRTHGNDRNQSKQNENALKETAFCWGFWTPAF